MKNTTVAVLGGDVRMHYAAHALRSLGHDVFEWGNPLSAEHTQDALARALENASVWVLPLPVSEDGVHLFLPAHRQDPLRLENLLRAAKGKWLLGGRLSPSFYELAEREAVTCTDYFLSESLQYLNALPTAEGAIEIAMRELPVTVDGAQFAVIGYGRIGEVLAQKLLALGGRVCVYARKQSARARASLLHCATEEISETETGDASVLRFSEDTRVIFNTVPKQILTHRTLSALPKRCTVIDLASAPGGADPVAAKELGIPLIRATALPGKYAPESAGAYVGQTVHEILRSKEVPTHYL